MGVGFATHSVQMAFATDPTMGAVTIPQADITHGLTAACILSEWSHWQAKSIGLVQPAAMTADEMQGI